MDTVVTEELRGRSGHGRRLVEGEEDVELVRDVVRVESQIDSMIRAAAAQTARGAVQAALRPHVPNAPAAPQPLDLNALSEALADPNTSPGPRTTELIRRERAEGKRRALNQPDVDVFLSGDYHSMGCNRFLFSCSTDADGCALNRGNAWSYAIPAPDGAGSSSASSHGTAPSNLGQIVRLPSHGGPPFTRAERAQFEQPAGPVGPAAELVPLGAMAREDARREGGWVGTDNAPAAAGSSATPLH